MKGGNPTKKQLSPTSVVKERQRKTGVLLRPKFQKSFDYPYKEDLDKTNDLHNATRKDSLKMDEFFHTTFDKAAVGMAHVGLKGEWIRVNKKLCEITGYSQRELLGSSFQEITHPEDLVKDLEYVNDLMSGKVKQASMEKRYLRKDGSYIWVRATGSIVRSASGKPRYGIGIVEDISERKQAEFTLQFLSNASKILAGSLDYHTTLSTIAKLVVPHFADVCLVDVLEEQNGKKVINRVKVAYHDSANTEIIDGLYKLVHALGQKSLVREVLRTGKSIVETSITDARIKEITTSSSLSKILQQLHMRSIIIAPLIARQEVLGSIMFVDCGLQQKSYTKNNLPFVEDLGTRIAFALDNARLYKKVQEAVQKENEFVSIASHELKTPLTTIKGFTQLLENRLAKKNDHRNRYFLSNINEQTQRLAVLIDDLLNIGKMEAGKFVLNKRFVNLDELIRKVVVNFQYISSNFQIIKEGEIKENIHVDPEKIEQVLTNLITNAIKYSPESDKVIVKVVPTQSDVTISIQDFGLGIPKKQQGYLFERFYRVLDKKKEKISGSGLGLFIASEIVKLHGGKIWVISKKGKGSTFSFSLPLPVS